MGVEEAGFDPAVMDRCPHTPQPPVFYTDSRTGELCLLPNATPACHCHPYRGGGMAWHTRGPGRWQAVACHWHEGLRPGGVPGTSAKFAGQTRRKICKVAYLSTRGWIGAGNRRTPASAGGCRKEEPRYGIGTRRWSSSNQFWTRIAWGGVSESIAGSPDGVSIRNRSPSAVSSWCRPPPVPA